MMENGNWQALFVGFERRPSLVYKTKTEKMIWTGDFARVRFHGEAPPQELLDYLAQPLPPRVVHENRMPPSSPVSYGDMMRAARQEFPEE